MHGAYDTYRDPRSGGARVEHNMDSRNTPFTVPDHDSTQPRIANSDRRHGDCDFGDESIVSSRRLLLRHNRDRRKLLAPTGIFPCSSIRVLFRSTRYFVGYVHRTPPCEFAVQGHSNGTHCMGHTDCTGCTAHSLYRLHGLYSLYRDCTHDHDTMQTAWTVVTAV